ncbi:MAG TPA: hypothetical protein VGI74_20790 [Streptosporangiaceae bacterium]
MTPRLTRSLLVASSALALAAGTAATAASAAPVTHAVKPDYRRSCAVTYRAGSMACMALVRTNVRQHVAAYFHGSAPVGAGFGPSSLISAYNLPSSTAVTKVAVVDAFNDPNAVSDLATYRSSWGLPACNTTTEAGCLTVTNQHGQASPLPANSGTTGWATEESLDVDMVSAICPSCHIYLVESNQPTTGSLGVAVDNAVKTVGAQYVSNSYGGQQSKNDPQYDNQFYKHLGDAIVASAGDSGYKVSYPAASQYVTSVGGTSLVKNPATTRGWTETVWGTALNFNGGTGSGCSKFEAKPSWQTHKGCGHRIDNDVSAVADPDTGVAVYDTYDQSGWLEVGGTSVSSPIIASVYALAGSLAAGSVPASYPYSHVGDLNDVTAGADGTCNVHPFLCNGEVGYDGPTGLGTPNGTGAFVSGG